MNRLFSSRQVLVLVPGEPATKMKSSTIQAPCFDQIVDAPGYNVEESDGTPILCIRRSYDKLYSESKKAELPEWIAYWLSDFESMPQDPTISNPPVYQMPRSIPGACRVAY